MVVPNQANDMHNGSIQQADSWLQQQLGSYVQWAQSHNSLLIVTWDEDNSSHSNQIPVIFVGPMVRPGKTLRRSTTTVCCARWRLCTAQRAAGEPARR